MSVFPPAFKDHPVMFEEERALVCPGCGESCLSHVEVVTYDRREDDQRILRATINNGDVRLRAIENDNSNPSRRRHGIVIKFRCETCDRNPELTIAQHKEQTLIDWR